MQKLLDHEHQLHYQQTNWKKKQNKQRHLLTGFKNAVVKEDFR
jgi:hypothetical protein